MSYPQPRYPILRGRPYYAISRTPARSLWRRRAGVRPTIPVLLEHGVGLGNRHITGRHRRDLGRRVTVAIFDCTRYRAEHSRGHRYADSGWCVFGCGNRRDGAVMNMRTGQWLRAPQQLDVDTPLNAEAPRPAPGSL